MKIGDKVKLAYINLDELYGTGYTQGNVYEVFDVDYTGQAYIRDDDCDIRPVNVFREDLIKWEVL